MNDGQFLVWIIERLIHVHNENPDTDFIHRLKKIAAEIGGN